MTANWKSKSDFYSKLIERWLSGECQFWALNAQFHINSKEKATP